MFWKLIFGSISCLSLDNFLHHSLPACANRAAHLILSSAMPLWIYLEYSLFSEQCINRAKRFWGNSIVRYVEKLKFMWPECFPFKLDVGFHIFLVLCIVSFFSGLIISFFDLVFCLFASKLWCPYSSVEFHLHCIFAVKLTSRNSCGAHWQGIWFNYVLVDRL